MVFLGSMLLALAIVKDDCAYYRKVSGDMCADDCVPATLGVCPRSLIVKTGGLEAGKCADVGFTVDKGEKDQACGPCGTLKFEQYAKAPAPVKDDCAYYRKVSGDMCADDCVPATLGVCPRSLIVKTGGLEAGKCADVGFTVDKGEKDQACGPCGTLKFEQYAKAPAPVKDDCAYYRKVSGDMCADDCVPATLGVCPRSLIVKTGGLEAGKCADVGFTVDKGEKDQACGPCGTLKFEQYAKAPAPVKDDCAYYRKVSGDMCADDCVPATLGVCPRSLIVKTGGLEAGKCADVGFTVDKGEKDQACGPCGTLKFEQYAKAPVIDTE